MGKNIEIPREYKKRVDKVVNHILKNIGSDLSLEKLAALANYSPFHFQRIFKEVVGESPKQYIIQVRLESALHSLYIHPTWLVAEVAEECGFSSPSIFSRAFKKQFNISPEEVRTLAPTKMKHIHKEIKFKFKHYSKKASKKKQKDLIVVVRRVNGMKGIHLIAPFGDIKKIENSFLETLQLVEGHELKKDESVLMCGILNPHQGYVYKTFISIDGNEQIPEKLFTTEIASAKCATIKIKGSFNNTVEAAKYFFHDWLPRSGYRISNNLLFEIFFKDPTKGYDKTERELCIPIELN